MEPSYCQCCGEELSSAGDTGVCEACLAVIETGRLTIGERGGKETKETTLCLPGGSLQAVGAADLLAFSACSFAALSPRQRGAVADCVDDLAEFEAVDEPETDTLHRPSGLRLDRSGKAGCDSHDAEETAGSVTPMPTPRQPAGSSRPSAGRSAAAGSGRPANGDRQQPASRSGSGRPPSTRQQPASRGNGGRPASTRQQSSGRSGGRSGSNREAASQRPSSRRQAAARPANKNVLIISAVSIGILLAITVGVLVTRDGAPPASAGIDRPDAISNKDLERRVRESSQKAGSAVANEDLAACRAALANIHAIRDDLNTFVENNGGSSNPQVARWYQSLKADVMQKDMKTLSDKIIILENRN